MKNMQIFVSTTREGAPKGPFISVDGSVPGAEVTWDHHVTGEKINLMAMPEKFDASNYVAVGTTLPDTDAMASIMAVLSGGKALLKPNILAILMSASHWCDHLTPLAGVSVEVNKLGRGLHDWFSERMRGKPSGLDTSTYFQEVCLEVFESIKKGILPYADTFQKNIRLAESANRKGLIRTFKKVSAVDLTNADFIDPSAVYTVVSTPVAVFTTTHRNGGLQHTVGVNPYVEDHPKDLSSALKALAKAEFSHGEPALSPEPVAGSENWGGRATVFGSPWNYGSRLLPLEVVKIITETLWPGTEED